MQGGACGSYQPAFEYSQTSMLPLQQYVPLPSPSQVDTTCHTVFNYVAQGLFERHKLIVSTQLCMAVLRARGELQRAKFDMLLRGPKVRRATLLPATCSHGATSMAQH